MSFWHVDGILFRELLFSSSSNNHLTWQRSISLCTCAPSPKCLDRSAPYVRRSRHHNLMERNLGVKIKSAYVETYCTPAIHTNPTDLVQLSEICRFEISQKTIRNLFKDCHAVFSLSLNNDSHCLSLRSCLIWGPINTPAFTFSKVSLGNFPNKYVNAGTFNPKLLQNSS